ncbi:MAG: DUF1684 domain-containing protein [Bacteroidota bacterium]|nr:DUF1684 domain-containing protein [Bacteroidota bacterium]
MKQIFFTIALFSFLISFYACSSRQSNSITTAADSTRVINDILTYRAETDSFFRASPASPFQRDTTLEFTGLKYFNSDLSFYFESKLYRYSNPDTVIVLGTKGDERKHLKYGYFKLYYQRREHRINVYKFTPYDSVRYAKFKDNLSFWFRDQASGKETYKIGRYVEIGNEDTNPEHIYVIDLNKAHNPYCAYSTIYSCPLPREEDFLKFEVRAGELNYHQ